TADIDNVGCQAGRSRDIGQRSSGMALIPTDGRFGLGRVDAFPMVAQIAHGCLQMPATRAGSGSKSKRNDGWRQGVYSQFETGRIGCVNQTLGADPGMSPPDPNRTSTVDSLATDQARRFGNW